MRSRKVAPEIITAWTERRQSLYERSDARSGRIVLGRETGRRRRAARAETWHNSTVRATATARSRRPNNHFNCRLRRELNRVRLFSISFPDRAPRGASTFTPTTILNPSFTSTLRDFSFAIFSEKYSIVLSSAHCTRNSTKFVLFGEPFSVCGRINRFYAKRHVHNAAL